MLILQGVAGSLSQCLDTVFYSKNKIFNPLLYRLSYQAKIENYK